MRNAKKFEGVNGGEQASRLRPSRCALRNSGCRLRASCLRVRIYGIFNRNSQLL